MRKQQRGPFLLLKSRAVYQNPWMAVSEDQVLRPGKKRGVFGVVTTQEGVSIVALDQEGYCYLVEEYGYGLGRRTLKLPSGGIEKGESPLAAAKRECLEETGVRGKLWRRLGSVHFYPTLFCAREHLFLVTDAERSAPQSLEDKLLVRVHRLPFRAVVEMACGGRIAGAESVSAILRAAHYWERRGKKLSA